MGGGPERDTDAVNSPNYLSSPKTRRPLMLKLPSGIAPLAPCPGPIEC